MPLIEITDLSGRVPRGVRPAPRRRASRSTIARRRRHSRSFRRLRPRRRRRLPGGTYCSHLVAAPGRDRTGRRLREIQRCRNSPRSPRNPPVDASHRPVAAPRRPSAHPPAWTSWLRSLRRRRRLIVVPRSYRPPRVSRCS
ncbi:hypothetical protein PUN28_007589 [Cardiocondyla obscurior]|uniref:Uncharacterized protein n=1 Tax=Cardiocondyla obscurior TaxID=286306 RepID=A0AAW2G7V5_9HYME